jgi:electron transfer flavoprotein beta subunit
MFYTFIKINFVNGDSEFDTNGVQYVINPATNWILTLYGSGTKQGATVTVVNVGQIPTNFKEALGIGANEAIRVTQPTDGFFAKQLAE